MAITLCPKIGDVLYSDEYDCKITVEALTTNNEVVCVWQDANGEPHRELLQLEELKNKHKEE